MEKRYVNARPNYMNTYTAMMKSVEVTLAGLLHSPDVPEDDIKDIMGHLAVIDEIARPAVSNMENMLQRKEREAAAG